MKKVPKYTANEKRMDIIFHKQNGKNNKEIAEFMRVCVRTVSRVWKDYQTQGKIGASVHNCGRKSAITAHQHKQIFEEIEKTPDITLNELIEKFNLTITEGGLSKYLKKNGMTYKKRVLIQPNRTEQMCRRNEENGKKQ